MVYVRRSPFNPLFLTLASSTRIFILHLLSVFIYILILNLYIYLSLRELILTMNPTLGRAWGAAKTVWGVMGRTDVSKLPNICSSCGSLYPSRLDMSDSFEHSSCATDADLKISLA